LSELVVQLPTQGNQTAYDEIQRILEALPDEVSQKAVLSALLTNRCRQCLDHDPQGQFWCCYDSRGDRI
jgi:hypothetical protein